ncbi:SusC/RagA family TonB-linked outer membrane protein [Pedobacter glucosidilyticus]|uniref:SusC/RagA family TonB-linked outer membrane protein n=1 Tax=Pedobacter glucosidilyticus TaxID=1122941 RepID=UPI0004074B54|nr:SusC/RagA family TonB-linked outer membrane protein [Pedobacter glucosidilyticus]
MKKLVQSLFILLFVAVNAIAQERTVTGTVTSAEDGLPLPGVSVRVKGGSAATQTNADGKYSISVPSSNSVLVFSFIGTESNEINVSSSSTINISLKASSSELSEVVVVGYGTSTKEAFTGSAKVVSGEALDRKNVSNVSQALAGEVAGVRVINTSGQPGTVATVRIRGLGSVNGSRDPLYVVDGVPFTGGLNSINPSDIQSVTVLKDAAATSIYGARGSNGVVVITTKNGLGQQSFIEVDANFGSNSSQLPRYDVIRSPEQHIGLSWEGIFNRGRIINNANPVNYANARLFTSQGVGPYNIWNAANAAALIDPATKSIRAGITRKYNPENWEDYAFQASNRKEINLKFGGSSDKTNYYTSFGYLDDKGYSINSDYERFSGRLNLTQQVNKWIKAGLNINYARSETNRNGQGETSNSVFWLVDNMPSIYPLFLRDANGEFVPDPIFGGNQFDYGSGRGFAGLTNAIADATYNTIRDNRNEINGNANLDFTILEGLTFENRLGVQYYSNKAISRFNKFYGAASSSNGRIVQQVTDLSSYNLLNLLRYNKAFGNHSFEALAAHEATNWDRDFTEASGFNLVDNYLLNLSNAVVSNPNEGYTEGYSIESYFGQLNYDFDKKYFLSATVRRDGSSRFTKDKWQTFGSVGAGWLITKENFMANQNIFKSLKLKASYGLIGDQAGVGFYPGFNLSAIDNLNDQPAIAPPRVGNPDLTWETSQIFQTGLEFDFGQYLSGTVEYYLKNTKDLIFLRGVGPSAGYASIQVNDGVLRNNGLEFELTSNFIRKSNAKLGISINGEIFSNKITKMPIEPATGLPKVIDVQSPYALGVGRSIFDFYMREWAGVDPTDGAPTWTVKYVDGNGNSTFDSGEEIVNLPLFLSENPNQANDILQSTTKTYSEATADYTGKSAIPDLRGALNLFGGYKGLELNVQFLYSFGGYAYDYNYADLMHSGFGGSNNWHTDILNRWQSVDNPGNGQVPRLSNDFDVNTNSLSTRFLTKANYIALNNVRLGYTIPAKYISKYGVSGLSLWVSGDNLWITTSRDGLNPSVAEAGSSARAGSQSRYLYAPLTTISAGLRVKL